MKTSTRKPILLIHGGAWAIPDDAAAAHGTGIRLFMKQWDNPHPGLAIESLDMLTGDQPPGHQSPAPFLVALTAEQ